MSDDGKDAAVVAAWETKDGEARVEARREGFALSVRAMVRGRDGRWRPVAWTWKDGVAAAEAWAERYAETRLHRPLERVADASAPGPCAGAS